MRRTTALIFALLLLSPTIVGAAAQQDDIVALVAGNTTFAFDLYGELRDDNDGNLLFSPYGVSQALAMTYAGAEGETATQMAEALGFTLAGSALHEAFGALNADLVARGATEGNPQYGEPAQALHLANGLWGEQTYPFSEDFSAQLAASYGAGLQETDFNGAPEAAREEINGWVAEQTEDQIQDIVPEGAISEITRMVLANAIYFYGGWKDTFSVESTSDDTFFLLDGGSVTTPFMVQETNLPHAQGDGYQVVELPYLRSGFAFTIILPDEGRFEAVEDGLDAATLSAATAAMASTKVIIHLPKFEFEYGAISLVETLQALGMADAFDMHRADFSGMMDEAAPDPLFISEVLHKAFIGVDEEGTEAAAATAVLIAPGAAPPEPEEPIELRIDRPFIFAIRDTVTGTVLFLGRVMDPSA
jgi:serpin B